MIRHIHKLKHIFHHTTQEQIFNIAIYSTYALLIISNLGISAYAPTYLDDLNGYMKIYVCLFLLWRFHPFRKRVKFTNLDRKIAFSAGLFILATTFLNTYLNNMLKLFHLHKQ